MSMLRPLTVISASLLVGGCISVGLGGGGGDPLTTYTLGAPAAPSAPAQAVTWQLVVEKPSAAKALASNRIVVMPTANVINVYEGVQWSDRTPELVQTMIIRGLETSGRIAAVDRPESGLRGDYTLVSEVRAFQAEYDGAATPMVRVALSLRLLQPARNRVLAAQVLEETRRAESTDVASVVRAFDAAAVELVAKAVAWTLDSGEANHVSGPPEPWR